MPNANRASSLSGRLDRLEQQIERLADLLAEQAVAKQRRRRLLTTRCLLATVVAFAVCFAWFGGVYGQSRRQARAVDQLIRQSAFVLFAPRESALVSLMPGDPRHPSATMVRLLGDDFFRSVDNVSTAPQLSAPRDKREILRALASLPELRRLRLMNVQLRTDDLTVLSDLANLHSLDVTRTGLDSGEMRWLGESQLRWFNASHTCFGDRALSNLARCSHLQQLRLERTCVTDAGLRHLHGMPSLRYVSLKRSPVSKAAVQRLSDSLPNCYIDWEPLRFQPDGKVDGLAARRGRTQFGRRAPPDPRSSQRTEAPLDTPPPQAYPVWAPQVRTYGRLRLDVF